MSSRRGLSGPIPPETHWIDVDGTALEHNLHVFRALLPDTVALMTVVKANAYGHGLAQTASTFARCSEWLGVHSAPEFRQIRELGVTCPVLVMGYVLPTGIQHFDSETHVLVSSSQVMEWLGDHRQRTGVRCPIHLKVDTGTHRQGFQESELPQQARRAAQLGLDVVGVATHFANIEDTLEHQFAQSQIGNFERAVALVDRELGERPPWIHAACSAAALLFREADFNLVRVGISAYGHWPSRETQLSWVMQHGGRHPELRPALQWTARVGQLQAVSAGDTVGYGRTWRATRPTTLAVVPCGYSDGYARALGNRARALVKGLPAPVVGRVCMNILMVDVTDVDDVQAGDEVVLIGRQDGARVSVEELAESAGTINYEFLARLAPSIPRYLRHGDEVVCG